MVWLGAGWFRMGSLLCLMVGGLLAGMMRDWTTWYVIIQGASPGFSHVGGKVSEREREKTCEASWGSRLRTGTSLLPHFIGQSKFPDSRHEQQTLLLMRKAAKVMQAERMQGGVKSCGCFHNQFVTGSFSKSNVHVCCKT